MSQGMDSGIARYLNDRCNGMIFINSSKRKGVLKYKTNNETVQTTQTAKGTDMDNRIHCTCMQYIFTTQTHNRTGTMDIPQLTYSTILCKQTQFGYTRVMSIFRHGYLQ